VSSPVALRSYAVDCARLARLAMDPRDTARLLNMARAWTELADRIEKLGQAGSAVGASAPQPDVPLASPPAPEQPDAANVDTTPVR
jgi:hypothetical protein